ncbi:hypothetical protein DICVIV_05931 [Dictyocaulus viviparus]|uniref:Uncharacterized protein n=1 Tax=Dictyocaulus viviparus TaxID=29172 RepID=A0A0D8Y069_DICVI|nr:hypothetical protein DICVIV_05931 [Dictyocaulus viviparus]
MTLLDNEENYTGLPYRVLWLALTKDRYCTFLKLTIEQWRSKMKQTHLENCTPSPKPIQTKWRKPRGKKYQG